MLFEFARLISMSHHPVLLCTVLCRHTLRAVRDGKVWLVDGNQMFNRPGPRLVDCLEWLVAILHGRRDMLPPGGFPAELLCGGDMVS